MTMTMDLELDEIDAVSAKAEDQRIKWKRKYYMSSAFPLLLHKADAGLQSKYDNEARRAVFSFARCKSCGLSVVSSLRFGHISYPEKGTQWQVQIHRPTGLDSASRCKECHIGKRTDAKLKAAAYAWMKEHVPCMDCGGHFVADAMEFDHRPGVEKVGDLSDMVRSKYDLGAFIDELAKCDVVCANCHRVRTRRRWDAS